MIRASPSTTAVLAASKSSVTWKCAFVQRPSPRRAASNRSVASRTSSGSTVAEAGPGPRARAPRPTAAQFASASGRRLHFGHVAVAMQDDVAPGVQRAPGALRQGSPEGLHRQIIADQQPVEADRTANDLRDQGVGGCRRLAGVDSGIENVGGHRHRHVGEHAEGREIDRLKVRAPRLDHRQPLMAVGPGAAVARYVLDDLAGRRRR